MKKICIILISIFFNSTVYSNSNQCAHRILFLPQTHASVLNGQIEVQPQWFEQTARSQYSIARYISTNRNIPIFSEQISRELSQQTASSDLMIAAGHVRSAFPQVPNTEIELEIFNKISSWRDRNPSAQFYSPEISDIIFRQRDRYALGQINEFFQKNPGERDVVLIYGSEHNFRNYPDLFPPQCVLVPVDFQRFLPRAERINAVRSRPSGNQGLR